jgi:hypothetical protein
MPDKSMKISAITPEKLLELLRKSGSRSACIETIKADIAAGAPVNPDGTINLIEYTAWLVAGSDDDD